jgi:hypothetical protein
MNTSCINTVRAGRNKLGASTGGFLAMAAIALALKTSSSAASSEKVLYAFPGGKSGGHSYAGLISDAQGNLYGTTAGDCDSIGGSGQGTLRESPDCPVK